MLYYAPILWIFLHFCSFCLDGSSFFWIFASFSVFYYQLFFYGASCTSVLPHYTVIYRDVIFTSVCRLLFYTIHCDKAQYNNGMRHKTAWLDRMIDRTFHQKGSDGTGRSSSSYYRKVPHQNLTFLLLFASFLFSFSSSSFISNSEGYRTIIPKSSTHTNKQQQSHQGYRMPYDW